MEKIAYYKKEILKLAKLNDDVELYPHQKRIVEDKENSKIIAHSVGSGKTLTAVAKFEKMKETGDGKKALVVVPSSLRENFGEKTVGKFTDSKYNIVGTKQEIKSGKYQEIDPDADYNIISYDIFKKNPKRYIKESGADTVITDEGHRGKNEGTMLTESLRNNRGLYKNHIVLTGSIISNTPADLQPLVDVTSNGDHNLGKSKKEFMDKFIKRDNSRKYRNVHENRRPIIGFENKKILEQDLKKYVDYVDYEDVRELANMPRKKVNEVKVKLSKEQAKKYKKLVNDDKGIYNIIMNKKLETLKENEKSVGFSKMVEARKLMNSLYNSDQNMSLLESSRVTPKTKASLDKLKAHLDEDPNNRAVLMSHMISGGIDVVEEGLKDRKIPYGKFIGKGNKGITEATRQEDVNDFNSGKKRVMLISSAGGEGLSLNDTTYEGVLDAHFNPEKMNQMEARGVRSGGLSYLPEEKREVNVDRFVATMPRTLGIFKSKYKTPDEVIYEIASNKEKQNKLLHNLLKGVKEEKPSLWSKLKSKFGF